jgi:hypothetical protein
MLNWEGIKHDHGFTMQRTPIPGGWLVAVVSDVMTPINTGYNMPEPREGYEWRTSITFVPDPNHEWKVNQ